MEFHHYCRTHPLISGYLQQLGDCKLEFEVEAQNYEEFNIAIDEVRQRFSGYIRYMEYMLVRRDYYHRTPCNVLASNYEANISKDAIGMGYAA